MCIMYISAIIKNKVDNISDIRSTPANVNGFSFLLITNPKQEIRGQRRRTCWDCHTSSYLN